MKYVNVNKTAHELGWKLSQLPIDLEARDDNKAWYILVEGIDGVGKTTFAKLLADNIRKTGFLCREVKEPYFSDTVHKTSEDFQKDREEGMRSLFLKPREWIVSDRSVFSTLAYNYPSDFDIENMRKWWMEGDPSHFNKALIYLSAPEKKVLKRLKDREKSTGLKREEIEANRLFQRTVKKKYMEAFKDRIFPLEEAFILTPIRHFGF